MLAGGSRKLGGARRGGEESRGKGRERERGKGRVFLRFEGRARATTFLLPLEFEPFDRSFRSHEGRRREKKLLPKYGIIIKQEALTRRLAEERRSFFPRERRRKSENACTRVHRRGRTIVWIGCFF